MNATYLESAATISPCGLYRYGLRRVWDAALRPAVFVLCNPSTADGTEDDPTIRRCVAFARRWGCGGVVVVNLFALRATDPRSLRAAPDPVGPDNDTAVYRAVTRPAAGTVVCAWGAIAGAAKRPVLRRRPHAVHALLVRSGATPLHLGLTGGGHPKHPLARGRHRVPDDAEPMLFNGGRL